MCCPSNVGGGLIGGGECVDLLIPSMSFSSSIVLGSGARVVARWSFGCFGVVAALGGWVPLWGVLHVERVGVRLPLLSGILSSYFEEMDLDSGVG